MSLQGKSQNLAPKIAESATTSSLRGSLSEAKTTKQSTKNNHMDCHDSASQNLAMTGFFRTRFCVSHTFRRISRVFRHCEAHEAKRVQRSNPRFCEFAESYQKSQNLYKSPHCFIVSKVSIILSIVVITLAFAAYPL
ncbi:hypothetical protein ACWIUD_03435 [Helicobacter sp. 23-1044]